jgi:hypothetical protein
MDGIMSLFPEFFDKISELIEDEEAQHLEKFNCFVLEMNK